MIHVQQKRISKILAEEKSEGEAKERTTFTEKLSLRLLGE